MKTIGPTDDVSFPGTPRRPLPGEAAGRAEGRAGTRAPRAVTGEAAGEDAAAADAARHAGSADPEAARPAVAPEPAAPVAIDSRAAHGAALRALLREAAQAGTPELYLCDRDFAAWPLGERDVVEAFAAWVGARRRLTLLAADFGPLSLRAPRWHAWRRQWSHVVQCLAVHEELAGRVPSLLFAPGLAALRLYDTERWRGRVHRDPAELVACRECCDALMQRAEESLPVTTLGL
jgi:hypothetical protein